MQKGAKVLSTINGVMLAGLIIIALILLFLSLKTSKDSILGAKVDEHGCQSSAGYAWSFARNECVKIYEEAVYLFKTGTNNPRELKGFAVFAKDNKSIDIFLPNTPRSFLLYDNNTNSYHDNESIYSLINTDKRISLKENGKEIYYTEKITE